MNNVENVELFNEVFLLHFHYVQLLEKWFESCKLYLPYQSFIGDGEVWGYERDKMRCMNYISYIVII